LVRKKAEAARRAGLLAIVCVGETKAERDAGRTLEVVSRQVAGSVPDGAMASDLAIAYEPVWAIGTGVTPTPQDVTKVHGLVRGLLARRLGGQSAALRILYGGSVKPENAAALLRAPECDGALVGGASLKAKDFLAIAEVFRD
jgi:triosephosphate isomerase